jgi:hypothetical protein
MAAPTIIAMGGGGFSSDPTALELERYILSHARSERPQCRIDLPVRTGDDPFLRTPAATPDQRTRLPAGKSLPARPRRGVPSGDLSRLGRGWNPARRAMHWMMVLRFGSRKPRPSSSYAQIPLWGPTGWSRWGAGSWSRGWKRCSSSDRDVHEAGRFQIQGLSSSSSSGSSSSSSVSGFRRPRRLRLLFFLYELKSGSCA